MSWSRFFRRSYWDRERARELESYLEIETQENMARGMSAKEARYAARRKLGNTTMIREEIFHMNSLGLFESLWHDLRYATRLLRLNPGFAFVAVISLALGIGANTAIFQLLDAVRLRNLPVKDPQELASVYVDSKTGRSGMFTGRYPQITNAIWEQIREHQQAFTSVAAWGTVPFDLSSRGEVRRAEGLWVSGEFFHTLGISAILGRVFTAEDDRRGCGSPGAVISYAFWQREFGGEPSAVGKKLRLDGHPFDIIGVTPPGFLGVDVGHAYDVAVPICAEPLLVSENSKVSLRWAWWLSVIGRIKPGWTLARADAQLRAISPSVFETTLPPDYPARGAKDYLAFQLSVKPAASGLSEVRQTYEDPLWLLIGISGLVLLIACANLANLLLARASAREREIAVRLTIGASRWRLVRQLLAESLLLSAIGAGFGVLLARNLSQALVSFLTTSQNRISLDLHLDALVLSLATGLAMLTCALFGLVPALRATRIAPATAMKAGGRGLTSSRERFNLQRLLVASQVALSLVLLFAALLFVRTFRNLMTLDMGFRADGVLVVDLDLRRAGYAPDRHLMVSRELLERIRSTPGVNGAAEARNYPMGDNWSNDNIRVDGPEGEGKDWALSNFSRISPDYFRTTSTPLLAGRDFNDGDNAGAPRVAIVNEVFARKFLAGNPLGRRFCVQMGSGQREPVYEIVGLAGNTKYETLREEFKPVAFVPISQVQHPWELGTTFLVRSGLPLRDLISSLQQSISDVNPAISVEFNILKTRIRESLSEESLMATLSSFFGLLAGLLATIGLYGVLSYMVSRRRNEIGIRMALGAARSDVVLMILRDAGKFVAIGLAAGIVLAVFAARAAKVLLYGLQPGDPMTLFLAVAGLGAVAALASYLPALRASKLEPMTALRDE